VSSETPAPATVPPAGWPALVLTAGLGTRLHPLSAVRAKPAVPVAGMPLAGHILSWLARWGVREAVLNLHHRPESITGAIGDGSAFGVRVRYSFEPEVLGSAGGPARALPLLRSPRFLIINGDTLTDVDLARMAAQHLAHDARVTMALVPNPDPAHYGGVVVAGDGRTITGFTRRGPQNPGHHFVGVQVVDADVFAGLDPDTPSESVATLYRAMVAAAPGSVQAFVCDAPFHDIGTAADYLTTALGLTAPDDTQALRGQGCDVAASATLERTIIWDHVRVGAGSTLVECVVADEAVIPAGASFRRQAIVAAAGLTPGPFDIVSGDLIVTPLDTFRPKD
jgi:NDP-sugar pyrophosphorylase family protein